MQVFIVHIGNFLLDGNSGVAQKTFAQAEQFRALGKHVEVVAFSSRPLQLVNHSFQFTRIETSSFKNPFEPVIDFFRTRLDKGDVVFFRYPFASQGLLNVAELFGQQIVFEHNTIEHQEALLSQKEHFKRQPFSISPSYFAYFIKTFIFKKTMESALGHQILRNVMGGICVTQEIAEYEQRRSPNYKAIAIGNAAAEPKKVAVDLPEFSHTLRVVMVLGTLHPWHGLDRALMALEQYSDERIFIELDLVGITETQLPEYKKSSFFHVRTLGRLTPDQLEDAMPAYHLAVGSLALHRIGLSEASPLKVRQCMMSGLPVVLGYFDTDASQSTVLSRYVCQFPADDSMLDWKKIVHFYLEISADLSSREKLIAAARSELSFSVKAKRYLDFIDSCMQTD
jgi:glycosyltransferase involved in cell wall biosynthesis